MTGQRWLVAMFILSLGVVTWDEIREQKRVPKPERYVRVGIVYVMLGVVALLGAPELAAAFGAGVVLMLLYSLSKATGGSIVGGAAGEAASGVGAGAVGGATGIAIGDVRP